MMFQAFNFKTTTTVFAISLLTACGGSSTSTPTNNINTVNDAVENTLVNNPTEENDDNNLDQDTPQMLATEGNALDLRLRQIIEQTGLTGAPEQNLNLPHIDSPKAQLGKQLFYTKNLGGEQSVACVSCHHPALGGGDALALSVGVNAVDQQGADAHSLLGLGRFSETAGGVPQVPRNAPTVFNTGLWQTRLFWDGRVQQLDNGIATPDSTNINTQDTSLAENTGLAAAQARFPVTSIEEMRGDFLQGDDNTALREALAARLANTPLWQQQFERAFGDTSVTFNRIAEAIGEFERSMVFTQNPWRAYIEGNLNAISEPQKRGAELFFTPVEQGGAGCSRCHSGDFFTDEEHHLVGFPQIGAGKGNDSGNGNSHDFGRENISGDIRDRFHFRTPSLLNVAVTAPYGHSGAYETLEQVVDHYDNPNRATNDLFGAMNGIAFAGNAALCRHSQFATIIALSGLSCDATFENAFENSQDAVRHINAPNVRSSVAPLPRLNPQARQDLIAFLDALTDPCVTDRTCLNAWIIDTDDIASFADDQPLIATDQDGVNL